MPRKRSSAKTPESPTAAMYSWKWCSSKLASWIQRPSAQRTGWYCSVGAGAGAPNGLPAIRSG